ncbi:MAG: hypothetical protein QXO00_04195 [Candidatus Bathyarchaeia archaeon]
MVLYECPKCGRRVEKPKGVYYCSVCGPSAVMGEVAPAPEPIIVLKSHPAMHAVWSVLDLDKTLSPTAKNVLWQEFVAAWNRRRLLTNEQAEALLKLRW